MSHFQTCLLVFTFFFSFSYAVTLRPAREEEIDALYELICELALFEGQDLASLSLSKDSLHQSGFGKNPYFFVEAAFVGDEMVGYALYFYGFSAHRGFPVLYVDDLYVKEMYRGQGIGTQFLKKLAGYGVLNHCCRMEWHVYDWNEPAIAFYDKLGAVLREDLTLVRLEKEALDNLAGSFDDESVSGLFSTGL